MTIDKYTKFILTLIAVGILGLNFYLYSGSFIKEAKAGESLSDRDRKIFVDGFRRISSSINSLTTVIKNK